MGFLGVILAALACFLGFFLFVTAFYALVYPNKVWFWRENRSRFSLFVLYAFSGFLMFVIGGSTLGGMQDPKERIAETKLKAEDDRKKLPRISYKEIRTNVEKLTDLQFDEYAKSLEGKVLDDSFYVFEVSKKTFGGYSVSLDFDDPQTMSIAEIEFEADKSFALSLKKNQRIKCNGVIESVTAVMGIAMVDLSDVSCKMQGK